MPSRAKYYEDCFDVFSKLCRDEGDVVGFIAYSLYKIKKREKIGIKKKSSKKKSLEENDLKEICRNIASDKDIQEYRSTAKRILNEILRLYAEDNYKKLNQNQEKIIKLLENTNKTSNENLQKIIQLLEKQQTKTILDFSYGVLQGIVAMFLAAIIAYGVHWAFTFDWSKWLSSFNQ